MTRPRATRLCSGVFCSIVIRIASKSISYKCDTLVRYLSLYFREHKATNTPLCDFTALLRLLSSHSVLTTTSMKLTFVTDLGQTFVVEIDPEMELENVMALLEAESSIPIAEQSISYENRELSNPKATISQLGVEGENAMLVIRRRVANIAGRIQR